MKKLKLLVVSLLALMVLPFCVNAAAKDPIKVHIFRGEGCGYCAAALSFFESIEGEYGQYFDLVEHEVWNNTDNAELMTKVADHFGEDVNGVPYIIIGEKTFQGYAETYNDEIISEIKKLYDSGDFVDVVAQIESGKTVSSKDSKKETNTTIIIIAVAIIGFVALFYFARDPQTEEIKESKKEEKIVEEPKEEKVVKTVKKPATKKTSAAKKTTTTKKTNSTTKSATKKPAKKTTNKKTTKK